MSVVEMSKIKLMGINSHKEKILDALYKTGCVELTETEEFADTFRVSFSGSIDDISLKYEDLNRTITFFEDVIEKSKNKSYYPKNFVHIKNRFVTYDEFIRASELSDKCEKAVFNAQKYSEKLSGDKIEIARLTNLNKALEPYLDVDCKLSDFCDTKTAKVFFGTLKKDETEKVGAALSELVTANLTVLSNGQESVVLAVVDKEQAGKVSDILAASGFAACPYGFDCTAKEKTQSNNAAIKALTDGEEEIFRDICESADILKDLTVLFDYYGFALEKEREKENFSNTASTFILEGFVPKDKAGEVKNAVNIASDAVFMEISAPKAGEHVPTLLKNNFAVRQTEFITDMYSTPDYKEKDPNGAVFFFFMLFMGVIMADIGYGVIMIALGLMLASRIKVDNGARRLWYNIAIGGVSAIIFGVLFNSLFGISVLPFTLLPSPVPSEGGQTGLMTILLGCLALGVIQIAFGYFMKALNLFKSGDIAGGIFDGLCWVLFFIGFVCAAFNFLIGYLMPDAFLTMDAGVRNFFDTVSMPGLIVMLSALFLAAATAGRAEKGFGKVSKSFGAVYGLDRKSVV